MNPYLNPYTNPYNKTQNGIIWVQGIEGAKAFQIYPNTNVGLFDSENEGVFYIKTSDQYGMCNLRIFKYEEIHQPKIVPSIGESEQFVSKADFDKTISEIKEMIANAEQSV